jgi:hypothetical protein
MKTPVALAAGMFLLLGSSPLIAGMDCRRCLYGATPAHVLYCELKNIVLCEDGCHDIDRMKSSMLQIPEMAKRADWGQKQAYHASWMKTPYETTFSPAVDRYQLVVTKLEVSLMPVIISLRLPKVFQ